MKQIATLTSEAPTIILVEKNATTKVIAKLYGPVDDARLKREQASLKHRLIQLSPLPKRREPEWEDDYDGRYLIPEALNFRGELVRR